MTSTITYLNKLPALGCEIRICSFSSPERDFLQHSQKNSFFSCCGGDGGCDGGCICGKDGGGLLGGGICGKDGVGRVSCDVCGKDGGGRNGGGDCGNRCSCRCRSSCCSLLKLWLLVKVVNSNRKKILF